MALHSSQKKLLRVRLGNHVRILQPCSNMDSGRVWQTLGMYLGKKKLGMSGPSMPSFQHPQHGTVLIPPELKILRVEIN